MKIPVYDVQHIINQIKRASPPVTKEMHKLINNLAILLEKNTEKRESPQELVLTTKTEQLNESFLDLCFLRGEVAKKYAEEYAVFVGQVEQVLEENKSMTNKEPIISPSNIDWDLDTECADTYQLISYIFAKLNKAKAVVEDGLENRSRGNKGNVSADAYFEAYTNKL